MNERGIRHVPVLENSVLKAILSIREFNLAYRRLQEQTRTDYMTGLANRRYFMETFEQELNRRSRFGAPLSVMTGDIDSFKAINDTYGHAAGDAVIRAIGALMVEQCRIYDTVSRGGGRGIRDPVPQYRSRGRHRPVQTASCARSGTGRSRRKGAQSASPRVSASTNPPPPTRRPERSSKMRMPCSTGPSGRGATGSCRRPARA